MRHAVCHMGYALSEKQYALGMCIIRFAACVMPYFLTGIVLTVWGLCWYNFFLDGCSHPIIALAITILDFPGIYHSIWQKRDPLRLRLICSLHYCCNWHGILYGNVRFLKVKQQYVEFYTIKIMVPIPTGHPITGFGINSLETSVAMVCSHGTRRG